MISEAKSNSELIRGRDVSENAAKFRAFRNSGLRDSYSIQAALPRLEKAQSPTKGASEAELSGSRNGELRAWFLRKEQLPEDHVSLVTR